MLTTFNIIDQPEVQQKYWRLLVHMCHDSEQLGKTLEHVV